MKALSIVLAVVAACLLALIAVFWFGGALAGAADLAGTHAGRRRGAGARCGILRAGHAAHDDRAAGWLKEAPGD